MKTSPYGLNSKTAKTSLRWLPECEMHQVGPKDSGSQNFSFLALKAKLVGEVQILRTATATATATDGIFFIAQIMFLSYKKS
jgi:hypothetical protein